MRKLLLAAVALMVAFAANAQQFSTTWDGKLVPGFAAGGLNVGGTTFTGVTGTGKIVADTAPTLGAITATSIVFSPTTGGQIGTTTNDAAAAGTVGELLSTTLAVGSALSVTTNTPLNMTSVTLTAGDWDVVCVVVHNLAATTTPTVLSASISTTTATMTTIGTTDSAFFRQASAANGGAVTQTVGPHRMSVASSTPVFCVVNDIFTTSTNTTYGMIRARRVR